MCLTAGRYSDVSFIPRPVLDVNAAKLYKGQNGGVIDATAGAFTALIDNVLG